VRLLETGFLWCAIGLAVALAAALRARRQGQAVRPARLLFSVALWPLAAPLLFGGGAPARPAPRASVQGRIEAVEAGLTHALARLPGLAGAALAVELSRVRGISAALVRLEQRLAELHAAATAPELDRAVAEAQLAALLARGLSEEDARTRAVRARISAAERLARLATAAEEDRERVLCELEAIAARLALVPFAAHEPEAEALRELARISATVEEVAAASAPA